MPVYGITLNIIFFNFQYVSFTCMIKSSSSIPLLVLLACNICRYCKYWTLFFIKFFQFQVKLTSIYRTGYIVCLNHFVVFDLFTIVTTALRSNQVVNNQIISHLINFLPNKILGSLINFHEHFLKVKISIINNWETWTVKCRKKNCLKICSWK